MSFQESFRGNAGKISVCRYNLTASIPYITFWLQAYLTFKSIRNGIDINIFPFLCCFICYKNAKSIELYYTFATI